ncbi:DNA polymerase subunit Cdc27 [Lasiodiplodia theobromae]|uniref:DNA polymerase delta subunit 3 n=1 Tax=Lasiodiplodia theobromae TaxID=45133 RepID=A0A5N5D8Q1_9PEZI|nr:DNA polymerase subunit Cdc27 [Lasiodiplodia theobromae]KAB2573692.1 DNA polymerase delta subunit 3 [Lasiodiplodia theobromae]KAF4540168.1 DNA polymerase subunit Cdc27 [Lasiodiplodia theobromae]
MDQYKAHLAARVLQESRPITYKLLSRELKVHVHQAKQMLYHFHATENQKKPGSVHATYIITGTKHPEPATQANGHGDEDVPMPSSPIPSSLPDAPAEDEESRLKVTSIKLVGEEHMDEARAEFEEITSIHVYSLEPGPLKDLQILSDCTREIAEKCADEDPLHAWETYGSIHNPHSKRRTPGIKPQAPAPVATSAPTKTAPRPSTTAVSSKEVPAKGRESQAAPRQSTPQVDSAALPKKNVDKQSLKKKEASSIFASFAKAQPKKKTAESGASTPATKSAEQSQAEDEPMRDASEEEGEDDDVVITGANQKSKEENAEAMKKARAEREAREKKLRDMMDEDDDDAIMQDAPAAASEELEEPEKLDADAPAPAKPEPEPEKKDEVTVSNGRRRGRRRVMKKKTYKDDEGYFVTKEEPVWESFSEDEPQPKKPKPNPTTTTKPKKGGGKQGQGSIMSFFAKKPS